MKKILIIDDDADTRESLGLFLKSAGHDAVTSKGGSEVSKLFQNQHWDLVITDIFMPEVDGIEVILKAKQSNPNLKILAISGGFRGLHLLEDARELGADRILPKPFSIKEFEHVVQDLL